MTNLEFSIFLLNLLFSPLLEIEVEIRVEIKKRAERIKIFFFVNKEKKKIKGM